MIINHHFSCIIIEAIKFENFEMLGLELNSKTKSLFIFIYFFGLHVWGYWCHMRWGYDILLSMQSKYYTLYQFKNKLEIKVSNFYNCQEP